jgi:hypothetical protein
LPAALWLSGLLPWPFPAFLLVYQRCPCAGRHLLSLSPQGTSFGAPPQRKAGKRKPAHPASSSVSTTRMNPEWGETRPALAPPTLVTKHHPLQRRATRSAVRHNTFCKSPREVPPTIAATLPIAARARSNPSRNTPPPHLSADANRSSCTRQSRHVSRRTNEPVALAWPCRADPTAAHGLRRQDE